MRNHDQLARHGVWWFVVAHEYGVVVSLNANTG
jgi:hypothetical protein